MPNPARQLLETFDRWSKSGVSPQDARNLANGDDRPEALREHVQAMVWIKSIEEVVDQIEASGRPRPRYRNALPKWTAAVLSNPQGWTDGRANRQQFTLHTMEILEGLADEIDLLVPDLTDVQRTQAFSTLDQIAELLNADGDIDDRLRQYIHRLLQHVRNCLEDYQAFGRFDLHDALYRLWVALQAAENQSEDPEKKKRWAGFRDVVWPTAVGTALGGLPQSIAQAIQAIGG